MKIHHLIPVIICFVLPGVAGAQVTSSPTPSNWQTIDSPGQPVDYYDYTSSQANNIEDTALSTPEHPATPPSVLESTPRPKISYLFSSLTGPTGSPRTVCQIVNQTDAKHPVYWFNPDTGQPLAGLYPFADPNLYNESQQLSPLHGMEFKGSFNGTGSASEPGAAAIETVYFTNRQCTDAGLEFGFYRELISADTTTVFYYSDYTNCVDDCHTQDDDSPSTLQNELAYTVSISDIQNNSAGNQIFIWRAVLVPDSSQPHGYQFYIYAIDPTTDALGSCSINGGALGPCEYTVPMQSWYHADWVVLSSGWVVNDVQAIPGYDGTNYYAPNVSPDAGIAVNWIATAN